MIYAWLGAILIGVTLGLLGSGGAILTIPILVYLVGQEEKAAIAESFAIVGVIALAGALRAMPRRNIDFRMVLLFGVPGMLGAAAGGSLARFIPGALQVGVLGILMLGVAALMFRHQPTHTDLPPRSRLDLTIITGFVVGMLTGLLGIGGGFVIVPALVLLGGLSMPLAVGTSLAIIFLNCLTSFAHHLWDHRAGGAGVDWPTIALFGALGIAGSLLGASIQPRLDQRTLRRIFAIFLIALAPYIIYRQALKVWPPHDARPAAASPAAAPSQQDQPK